MKTAMQELKEALEIDAKHNQGTRVGKAINMILEAIPYVIIKEKEQIIEAYTLGHCMHDSNDENSAEDYYNQTFKTNP